MDCEAHEPYYGLAEPPEGDLGTVAGESKACQACHLWMCGTQTVFGAGPQSARMMLIGEQPGDKEDLEGKPFVGPAGKLLRDSLAKAAIREDEIFLTNAVKHFKWEAKGARRIHKKPNRAEMNACRPWLEAELRLIQPEVVVLLGATAAQSLLGPKFKLLENRGREIPAEAPYKLVATVHPSALLRIPEKERRITEREAFIRDLAFAQALLSASPSRRMYMS